MKIYSPNTTTEGRQVYGTTPLDFVDGVAEVDEIPPGVLLYLEGAGYTVEPEVVEPEVVDDLDDRTVDDLRGYAVEHGVDLGAAKLKADIVAAIRAHFAALPDRQDDGIDPA